MKRSLTWLFPIALWACGARTAPSLPDAGAPVPPPARSTTLDKNDESAAWEVRDPRVIYNARVTSRAPDAELKVAFFGDQGVKEEARRVLQLVADEAAEALIVLGDLIYEDEPPEVWENQINEVLGAEFPVFAVIGNHDMHKWYGENGFGVALDRRAARTPDARCEGDYGVRSTCTFRGVDLLMSGIGTYGDGHAQYLEAALQRSTAPFRVCLWHKNQHDMQIGAKRDEVGWETYQVCARHGAPVITGHEHSYARTQLLTAIGDRENMHGATGDAFNLDLAPGRTFVVVAGLGGMSRRERTADHAMDSWWASIYARDDQRYNGVLVGTKNEILDGALFITFRVDGDRHKASGYFKTVDGQVHDAFIWRVPERTAP